MEDPDDSDYRMLLVAAAGWLGGLVALLGPRWLAAGLVVVVVGIGLRRRRRRASVLLLAGCLLSAAAVGAGALVRVAGNETGPVARLAAQHAVVGVVGRVASDPVSREGRHGDFVIVRLRVQEVTGRGVRYAVDSSVVALAETSWAGLRLGAVVRATGRLAPAEDRSTAATFSAARPPTVVTAQPSVLRAAEAVRGGIRAAVSGSPPDARSLVPALVVGDDRQMSARTVDDFRTCGLTHLAAVSGTNLTLIVGFVLVLARWAGVRGRGLLVVGLLGVVGFVLLARTEPSVVRAAAMGSVALLGMGAHGRRRGVRALGVAVWLLLLVDPWLLVSYGFVLSVLATAGILVLAPVFRDRMATWLPRWAAEAVAVPLAAQIACTPVVAALSGQVSLVAVLANILVAPAVGPATVLGLLGGLLTVVVPVVGSAVGSGVGFGAGAFGWWIVAVAHALARVPVAAVDWAAGPVSLAVLTLLCAATVAAVGWLLGRRRRSALVALALVAVMSRPLPTPGWPPGGWVLVACDVGQGDGIVLNAGGGRAVVVDVGPDPTAMAACLRRLDVREVPLLVLSHFHADHVDGLPGVLDRVPVGGVLVTGTRAPAGGAAAVDRWLREAHVPGRVPRYGESGAVGAVNWQVVGPVQSAPSAPETSYGEEGSVPNNASLVLLCEVRGVRLLATGDVEPPGQADLARTLPGLHVDVLKVPHHGSAYQDADFLQSLEPRMAVVSVGEDNDYGHPAPRTVALLRRSGATVARTDLDGDLAVVLHDGALTLESR